MRRTVITWTEFKLTVQARVAFVALTVAFLFILDFVSIYAVKSIAFVNLTKITSSSGLTLAIATKIL